MFIIRNRGFFYTDEYHSTTNTFRQVRKTVFATRAAAEKACAAMIRKWVCHVPLDDFLFESAAPVDRVMEYLHEQFPELELVYSRDLEIPRDATDEQIDEIVRRMGITFAEVHEVSGPKRLWTKPDESQHLFARDQSDEALWYGPGWDDRSPAQRKADGDGDDLDQDD